MKITTHDPRTIKTTFDMEFRQNVGNGTPKIQIEHRKINSKWWDINSAAWYHTQENWDQLVKMEKKD